MLLEYLFLQIFKRLCKNSILFIFYLINSFHGASPQTPGFIAWDSKKESHNKRNQTFLIWLSFLYIIAQCSGHSPVLPYPLKQCVLLYALLPKLQVIISQASFWTSNGKRLVILLFTLF